MALKLTANTTALSARERQFFQAIVKLTMMSIMAGRGPGASNDEVVTRAAQIIADMFPDLVVEAIEEQAASAAGKTLLN